MPFCGTFLIFADYMKPAIRLAAMMGLRVVYVLTHDSFYLGEDGPTHQPVEQLAMLRAIPGLTVIRPADGNETIEAWKWALSEAEGPVALALTRQGLPTLDRQGGAVARGAYVLYGAEARAGRSSSSSPRAPRSPRRSRPPGASRPRGGACASSACRAGSASRPSRRATRTACCPPTPTCDWPSRAGRSQGWERWIGALGEVHGFDRFGASGPAADLAEEFGFDTAGILAHARQLLESAPQRAARLREQLA